MVNQMWLYFKRQPLRIVTFVLVVVLGVAVSIVLSSIFLSFAETRNMISKVNENWITVQYPSRNGRDEELDRVIEKALASAFGVSQAIKVDIAFLSYNLFGSARANFPVYGIPQTKLPLLLKEAKTHIKAGTIFEPNSSEIMVSDPFLKAENIELGVVYEETGKVASAGQYSLVASMEGPSIFGFGPEGISENRGAYGYIVLAEDGFLLVLESELKNSLAEYGSRLHISGPASSADSIARQYGSYYVGVLLVDLVVAFVFTLGLTMLNSVSLRERRKEYAVLAALGYTPAYLRVRLFIESSLQAAAGWFGGIFLGSYLLSVFERRFFEPNGLFLGEKSLIPLYSLVIPVAVVFLTQLLVLGYLRGDLVNLLKDTSDTKIELKSRFREGAVGWLAYPLRTASYRPLFINTLLFVALIIFFGALSSLLSDGIKDSGALFAEMTYVETQSLDGSLSNLALPEGVDQTFEADIEEASLKLPFGTQTVYIPALSSEGVRELLKLKTNPAAGTLYVSAALAEQLQNNLSLNFDYVSIEKRTDLPGLSGVLVREDGNFKGQIFTYQSSGAGARLRQIVLKTGQTLILDTQTFETEVREQTQFIDLLARVIVYLQFFVLLVIAVVTVTRIVIARKSEIAIRNIIGLAPSSIRGLLFGELVAVLAAGTMLGSLLGIGGWYVVKTLFFSTVYVSSLFSPPTVLRIVIMGLAVLLAGYLSSRFFTSKVDPLSMIER